MERQSGTVVYVVKERGFWFILCEGHRYFCHISNWSEIKMPAVGDQVSFEFGPSRQSGFQHQAVNARPDTHAGVTALASKAVAE